MLRRRDVQVLAAWVADGDVSFVGNDGPRLFPVTAAETQHRLEDFLRRRLAAFGPHEDAMLAGDPWLAHSMLSASMNLGLADPARWCTAPRTPTASRWPPGSRRR